MEERIKALYSEAAPHRSKGYEYILGFNLDLSSNPWTSTLASQLYDMFSLLVALVTEWLATSLRRARDHSRGYDHEFDDSPGGPPPRERIEFQNRSNRILASLRRPNSPSDSGVRPTAQSLSQSTSAFNILPLEVRLQIWRDAVGGHAFHLTIYGHDRRFVGWMCSSPDPHTCRMSRYSGRCRPLPLSEAEMKERRNVLALLRTCRQM
jgi:hypothetical protein